MIQTSKEIVTRIEMTNQRYRLILDVPDRKPPAVNRLRSALKVLLRGFGIRCVEDQAWGVLVREAKLVPAEIVRSNNQTYEGYRWSFDD